MGYALSAKKLRKGEIKDSIWRGGGLADILLAPENTVEGVHFQSISSYNKNALLSKESRVFHLLELFSVFVFIFFFWCSYRFMW